MKKFIMAVLASSLLNANVWAAPSDELIAQYNAAAQGNKDSVELVYESLEKAVAAEGPDPLSLVYLGSTQTLMGRDAFLPWNKMKFTEQGLATISKGLGMLKSHNHTLG